MMLTNPRSVKTPNLREKVVSDPIAIAPEIWYNVSNKLAGSEMGQHQLQGK